MTRLDERMAEIERMLTTYFPDRAPTAPHDLAFLLGQRVEALEGYIQECLDDLLFSPHVNHTGPIAHGWTTPVAEGCFLCSLDFKLKAALRGGRTR